jgi:hypothetical protein
MSSFYLFSAKSENRRAEQVLPGERVGTNERGEEKGKEG